MTSPLADISVMSTIQPLAVQYKISEPHHTNRNILLRKGLRLRRKPQRIGLWNVAWLSGLLVGSKKSSRSWGNGSIYSEPNKTCPPVSERWQKMRFSRWVELTRNRLIFILCEARARVNSREQSYSNCDTIAAGLLLWMTCRRGRDTQGWHFFSICKCLRHNWEKRAIAATKLVRTVR